MKKICMILAICLLLAVPASAAAPEPAGWALYTDIVARINGHPIRSYNIDGYTAVMAEELRGYGFCVLWNAEERTLRLSRSMRDGEPETPEVWPAYTPEPLNHRVGARARRVYETDIKTYAAGEWAPHSCNLDGETLVRIDDLAGFGSVVWDADARVIELTLGDPVEIALEEKIANVEAWRDLAGAGSGWTTWESGAGTLLLTRYTGTPHGTSNGLIFLHKNGEKLNILDLLPFWGFGSAYYFNPRDIKLDEQGYRLSFVTVLPEDGGESFQDTLCTVDLLKGRLLSSQPLDEGLTDWSLSAAPADASEVSGGALELTVVREGAEVKLQSAAYPGRSMLVSIGPDGLQLSVYAAAMSDEAYQKSSFAAAWEALRKLGLREYEAGEGNTPEQRAAAAQYLRVTCNGEALAGNLWWSQGNNHGDWNLTFDKPLHLKDGDTVRITMG